LYAATRSEQHPNYKADSKRRLMVGAVRACGEAQRVGARVGGGTFGRLAVRIIGIAGVLGLLLVLSGSVWAYSSGPPVGLTGAPGEGTCANCHGNLNVGPGWVSISAPSDYSAGETIEVAVEVGQTGQQRWGFEITALDGTGQPVGHFAITDAARTQLDVDGGSGREYVSHTSLGTDPGVHDVSPGWTLEWTAPPAREDVTFYASGVAANNAQGSNGDYVYTTNLSLSATGVASTATSWGRIKGLFR
jgi:hypothetical protein